jgi:hypothetical protein
MLRNYFYLNYNIQVIEKPFINSNGVSKGSIKLHATNALTILLIVNFAYLRFYYLDT